MGKRGWGIDLDIKMNNEVEMIKTVKTKISLVQ